MGAIVSALRAVLPGLCVLLYCAHATAETHYLIVSGLGGEPAYAERFEEQAQALADAARNSVASPESVVVLSGEAATAEAIESAFEQLVAATDASDSVAVFLLGHGSYDGEQYKFNIPGHDLDGERVGELLAQLPAGTVLVVNATSASGAVLEQWAGDGRTVITATRSGAERNATRFGDYWAQALSSESADINKNGIITAQEAFDFAERSVADSYTEEDALATEHPQLSGDGAQRFAAARLVPRAVATPQQRELTGRLDALEEEIAELRTRRDSMPEEEYLSQLQALLVELATTRRELDAETSQETDAPSTTQ